MEKKKILVIDDEAILTKTFTLLLEKNGYEVMTAKNGEDAQILAESEKYDLIICDIRMPAIDGVQTASNIRNSGGVNAGTPLIFVTGYADAASESAANELNPIAYIYKPFDNKKILRIIQDAMDRVNP